MSVLLFAINCMTCYTIVTCIYYVIVEGIHTCIRFYEGSWTLRIHLLLECYACIRILTCDIPWPMVMDYAQQWSQETMNLAKELQTLEFNITQMEEWIQSLF